MIELFFPLITFESAYKPNHPRETGFTITWSHIFFTPNLALNFPLTAPKKSDSRSKIYSMETGQMSLRASKSTTTETFPIALNRKTNAVGVLSVPSQ